MPIPARKSKRLLMQNPSRQHRSGSCGIAKPAGKGAHIKHHPSSPLVMTNSLLLKMDHLYIVDLPKLKMVIFHSYVSLLEGKLG